MTVKDLIKELNNYDQDLEVVIYADGLYTWIKDVKEDSLFDEEDADFEFETDVVAIELR
jgi:hypothetical protein